MKTETQTQNIKLNVLNNTYTLYILSHFINRREFALPSAWSFLISLLVEKGFYICQK